MTEAWAVREWERQELREKLKRLAYRMYDEIDDAREESPEEPGTGFRCWLLELAQTILIHLGGWGSMGSNVVPGLPGEAATPAERFFNEKIRPEVEAFGRTLSEQAFCYAKLLDEFVGAAVGRFHSELLVDEQTHPDRVFHASSAMEEVDLPDESDEG